LQYTIDDSAVDLAGHGLKPGRELFTVEARNVDDRMVLHVGRHRQKWGAGRRRRGPACGHRLRLNSGADLVCVQLGVEVSKVLPQSFRKHAGVVIEHVDDLLVLVPVHCHRSQQQGPELFDGRYRNGRAIGSS
jgi:hypothetical protein